MKTYSKIIIAMLLAGALGQGMAEEARAKPAVTPVAAAALKEIGSALQGLRDYTVDMDFSTRAAIGGGKYREFTGKTRYVVRPPAHLYARVEGQGGIREVYYDGVAMTVHDPLHRRYARMEAPGTIRTLLERVKAMRGLELPIADLFAWGTSGGPMSAATLGRYAGTGSMRGRACEHYAYKEQGVSWEVWVDGEHLPCKLVMVDTQDPGLPGYSADITWNAAATSTDAEFRFTPGAGVAKVEIEEIAEFEAPQGTQP